VRAQRPERDTNNGPDVLWSVGSLNYLVIECKSGATADRIWRSDAAQLAHSMQWFGQEYDNTCRPVPVLVHRTSKLAGNATAPAGTRVITVSKLGQLHAAIRAAMTALADAGTWDDPAAVSTSLPTTGLPARR
jgi:hypothetical protein